MKVSYYNRYGDDIIFEKLEDNKIHMYGFVYYRTGYNEEGSALDFVDPAGGPYISVGTNLKNYFKSKKDMIVKSIEYADKGAMLTI
jgi:hypothetical protein